MKKRWLACLLALIMLLPAAGPAESAGSSASWLYSFSAGEILSGKEMDKIREFLDAVQLQLGTETRDDQSLGEAILLSYGKPVFTLRAASSSALESIGLYCSLMGDCTLMCRQDQVSDFLTTLVRMLADYSILKQESLEKAENLAARAGNLITSVIENRNGSNPSVFFDLQYYLQQADRLSSSAETAELDPANQECPGAVLCRTWHLNEAELNSLAETGIEKLKGFPLLGDAFVSGQLKIGSQAVTDVFLRDLFASMHGDTTLVIYTDAEEKVLRLSLRTPDLSGLVEDPEFSRVRGLEFSVSRETLPDGISVRETGISLSGLEGTLLSIRMEKRPGCSIPDLPRDTVYQVGEMNSSELWDLLRGLWLTIGRNAINLIMDLPRIVFDTLIDRLF